MARTVMVVAETQGRGICPSTLEAAGFAAKVLGASGGKAVVAALGHPAGETARKLAAETGLDVIGLDHELLASYNCLGWVDALAALAAELGPSHIIIPHSATGWDYAARLAVRLGGVCVTGVSGMTDGYPPGFIRSILGGKLAEEITPQEGLTAVVTVLPGASPALSAKAPGSTEVRRIKVDAGGIENLGLTPAPSRSIDLTRAEVIVAAGRGIGAEENLALVHELASLFDKAAVGASRPVVDAGWLPIERQVGQTGQTVRPKLYLALGISGAIQHAAGMSGSEMVAAINSDERALIWDLARVGVVHDLHEFLPVLIERMRMRREKKFAPGPANRDD